MNDVSQVVVVVILGLAFLTLFGSALAVVLVRIFERSESLETLRERYARGEIDTAAFDEMRDRLRR